MITQISVVVHNSMPFNDYLNHQVKKQIHWNDVNRTDRILKNTFSSIGVIHRVILNMVIDKYNQYTEPYEDVSMDEREVDWD